MTAPQHAASRRRPAWRAELIAWLRHPVASISLWLAWWEWPVYQAHTLRQYKRDDRKAFAAECDEIRAAAHVAGMTPETPAAVSPCGAPEEAPVPLTPPAGPGTPPGRDTWVVYPPSGRHVTATPRMVPVDDTVPLKRLRVPAQRTPTRPNPVLRPLPLVRPWLVVLVDPETGSERYRMADARRWMSGRDAARAATG